jgi:hypothetical protein
MPSTVIVLIGVGVVALVVMIAMSVAAQRRKSKEQAEAVALLGFRDCPEKAAWLQQRVLAIENNKDDTYRVEKARSTGGSPPVYYYTKRRDADEGEQPYAEEELLFQLRRPAKGTIFLVVKSSAIQPGLATRLISQVATGPWDTQADDLAKVELPPDIQNTNILGALGPKGAAFYDLIEPGAVSVFQGIGDAGGLFIRMRGEWCSISNTSHQIPFRVDQIVERMRPLI